MRTKSRGFAFAVIVLLIGIASVIIAAAILFTAFGIDRPDAAVFMRRSLAMAIPIFFFGAGVTLCGTYLLFSLKS